MCFSTLFTEMPQRFAISALERPSTRRIRKMSRHRGERVPSALSREPRACFACNASSAEADGASALDVELAAIDAVLARSEAVLKQAAVPTSRSWERDPLVYDLDWDEDARLEEWRAVLRQADHLPPLLQAVVALDAWNTLARIEGGMIVIGSKR